MTPIEEVKPTQPSNWTRRPEGRIRRNGPTPARDRDGRDRNRPEQGSGKDPDDREHIVDELA